MKISEHTISALARVITGDGDFTPYRSGPQLVAFFNQFGSDDTYGGGFPSRWYYAEEKLREFNDTPAMKDIIISALDPRHFLMTEFQVENAIEHVNQFLEYDDFQVLLDGKKWRLCKIDESGIEISLPYTESTQITQIFISEQIEKCDKKLSIGDYDGAITNARSLMEAVLTNIEQEFDNEPPKYDGNLPKLYRRVQKLLPEFCT